MDTNAVARYVRLKHDHADLEAQAKRVKTQLDELEPQLVQAFAQDGVQSVRTVGGLAYLHRQIWAKLTVTPEEFLCSAGELDYLVKLSVNQVSLSAAIRELPRDDNDMPILPEEVMDSIQVTEVFKINVRKE